MNTDEPLVYTPTALARAFKKRVEFVKFYIEDGQLGTVPLGNTEVVPRFEAERWLREQMSYKKPKREKKTEKKL